MPYLQRLSEDFTGLADTAYGGLDATKFTDSSSAFRILSAVLKSDPAKRDSFLAFKWSADNTGTDNANQRTRVEFVYNASHRQGIYFRKRTRGGSGQRVTVYINLAGGIYFAHHQFDLGTGGVGGEANSVASWSGMVAGDRYRVTATLSGTASTWSGGSITVNSTVTLALSMERWNGGSWVAANVFSSGTSSTATLNSNANCCTDYGEAGIIADEVTQNNGIRTATYWAEGTALPLTVPTRGIILSSETNTSATAQVEDTGGVPPVTTTWRKWNGSSYVTQGTGDTYSFTSLTEDSATGIEFTVADSDSPASSVTRQAAILTLPSAAVSNSRLGLKFLWFGDSHTNGGLLDSVDGSQFGIASNATAGRYGEQATELIGKALATSIPTWTRAITNYTSSQLVADAEAHRDLCIANSITDVFMLAGYNDTGTAAATTAANLDGYADIILEAPSVVRVWYMVPPPKWDLAEGPRIKALGALLEGICDDDTTGKKVFGGWQWWWSLVLRDDLLADTDGTHYEAAGRTFLAQLAYAMWMSKGTWFPVSSGTSSGGAGKPNTFGGMTSVY